MIKFLIFWFFLLSESYWMRNHPEFFMEECRICYIRTKGQLSSSYKFLLHISLYKLDSIVPSVEAISWKYARNLGGILKFLLQIST